MTQSKRKQVKPVEQSSIADKRFKRTVIASNQVTSPKVHPLIVMTDLRKGSLASLSRYLAQEGGIPDRAVAIELRKLISGSVCRSRFRLMVVGHPDSPNNQGGRRSEPEEHSVAVRRQMVAKYEEALPLERGKKHLARARVATKFDCSDTTVKRAIRFVRDARLLEEANARREELKRKKASKVMQRRDAALSTLRKEAKTRTA
jgi:hypothetical protein